MIHKVSNQNQISWVETGDERSFQRDGMNKSAMDSFSNMLVVSASALLEQGHEIKDIANKFNLDPQFLSNLLKQASTQKLACECEQEEYIPEMKSDKFKKATGKKRDRELSEEEMDALEAYNSLHNIKASGTPSLPSRFSNRILSNKGNDVIDTGGARKQMGYERNNSIFDPNVIKRQSQERTNDEILQEKKMLREMQRLEAQHASRYETIDGESIVDGLKNVDQRKDAGIRSVGATEAHKYDNKLPLNGISIFDTTEFQRVPDKTAGEQRRQEIKTAASQPKDRSWVKSGSKSVNSSDIVSKFIDSMLNSKKKG